MSECIPVQCYPVLTELAQGIKGWKGSNLNNYLSWLLVVSGTEEVQ